jgi:hypothetical protein
MICQISRSIGNREHRLVLFLQFLVICIIPGDVNHPANTTKFEKAQSPFLVPKSSNFLDC